AKVVIDAPAGAVIVIDGAQVGVGKAEQTLPAGGHQLRVTAPGMRTYQTDLTLADKETRSMSVVLEAEAPAVKPTLRVAVGCGDSAPKGPADGLVVYLDGPDVLPPSIVKQTWNPDQGQNVVDHVEYTLNAGKHTARVALLGCYGYDVQVDVDPVKGADISGALETSRGTLVRGPQGAPGWFQGGLGLWLAGGNVKSSVPDRYASRGISIVGEMVELAAIDRWFGTYVDFSYGTGSFNRTTYNSNQSLPDSVGVKWTRLDTRFGPRFPFNVVSLGFGPKLGWEKVEVDPVRTGTSQGFGGAYFEVAFEPLCDWGAFLNLSIDKPFNDDEPSGSAQFGFMWAPSPSCHRERDTDFGLKPQTR
ncbi:MAG: PEGA domain-containing protein, partial [Polyangiaceae bacterium]